VLVIVLPPSDSLFTVCISFTFSGGLGGGSPQKKIYTLCVVGWVRRGAWGGSPQKEKNRMDGTDGK